MNGLRSRLHDKQFPGFTILGPFNIHGAVSFLHRRVMFFNPHGPAAERENLFIGNREAFPVDRINGNVSCHLPAPRVVNQFELLGTQRFFQNRLKTLLQRLLEHIKLIRVHTPLDNVFPQPVSSIDQNGIFKAGFRINRKHDSRSSQIRTHHALNSNRKRDVEMIETLFCPVGDCPIRKQ